MRVAAMAYAGQGWRILPVWWLVDAGGDPVDPTDTARHSGPFTCGCGNPYCETRGKHPIVKLGRGMADASSDASVIESWWSKWPHANIAVATGSRTGIVVVDLDLHDPEADGEIEFGAWAAGQGFEIPPTLMARTGGGGRHLIYRAAPDDGGPPIKNATGWLPGVDLRGEGGYVLVAPSTHESGGVYEWISEQPIAELGPLLGPLRSARGAPGGKRRDGTDAPPPPYDYREACRIGPKAGHRDHFFNARAFELRRSDVAYDEALADIRRLWESCEQTAGNEFTWDTAKGKLDRVWEEVDPDPLPDWNPLANLGLPAEDEDSPRGKLTDLGNAQRFADLKTGTVLHTAQAGWLRWDGTHWRRDTRGVIVQDAVDVVETVYADARNEVDDHRREQLLRWANASESAGRIEAMLKLARGMDGIAADVLDLDPDPWLLNVANGVLDLRTGELGPHDPDLLISRVSEVTFDLDARDDRWDRFIQSVTCGDDDLARYLQRAAGYTLTADTREEVFFIVYGPQASGKSTLVDALMTVLGDMAMITQADTLLHQRGNTAPKEELASMLGKRMVATIEIPDGGRFAEGLVKQLTGGDKIAARHLYKDRFEFTPSFKLWIATNHAPRAYDDAIWRRIKRVPFPRTVPVGERDPRLKAELKVPRTKMASAVLAWAVRGCLEWQASGLGTCAAVEADTAEYESDQDKFGRFLQDELILDPESSTSGRDLYERYKTWCDADGERPMTATAFSIKLRDRGFVKNAAVRPIAWRGLALQERSMYGL